MAIDLFCYTSYSEEKSQQFIEKLAAKYPDLFSSKFIISKAQVASTIGQEIAMEHGFNAKCRFLIMVNDKGQVNMIREVADTVRTVFGSEKVLILFDNEVPR